MTDAQRTAIEKHGRKLLVIFPHATERDPMKLCKHVRRLETMANKAAVNLCNIPDYQDRAEEIFESVDRAVTQLLGNGEGTNTPNVFINRDPRGYALKISSEYVKAFNLDIPRDWGGYGIIAPEIGKDGN